jgi:NitT/TauT family transport system permease protein
MSTSSAPAGVTAIHASGPTGAVTSMVARLRNSERARRLGRGAIGSLAFFLLCQVVTMLRPVSEEYLPSATSVVGRLAELLTDVTFLERLLHTLQEWAAGMGLAIAIGVPLGVLLGASSVLYRVFRGPLELLRPIPGIALIPLFILVFGQTFQATMWLVVYACVWPILLNTLYGVHDVAPTARDTARSYGLGRAAILARVYLPSALPLVLTGVRVAASVALVVAVAVELIVGTGVGVGSYINELTLAGGPAKSVYAAAAAAGLLGLLINVGVRRVEGWVVPWRDARRAGG